MQAELAHALDHGKEGMTLVREGVLDPRRHFGEAASLEDVGLLEALQPLRQGLRTDAVQRSLQLTEAALTGGKVPHDEGRPLVAHDLSGTCHRTPVAVDATDRSPVGPGSSFEGRG